VAHHQGSLMTAIPDFSIRMQVAGMRGLLSEIIAVGALSKHGDTDLMERVREAADTPMPPAPAAVEGPAYSLDADPDGIRARAADAIKDALARGFQDGEAPPAGHWLELFWRQARFSTIQYNALRDSAEALLGAPALEGPAALEVIDIGDDGQLRMDPNMPGAWQLFRRDSHIRYLDKFERNFVNSAIRAALTETARAPAGLQAAPVAGQSRFAGETTWGSCTVEHVDMVLAAPTLWGRYEVRYLYAAPALEGPAAPAGEGSLPSGFDVRGTLQFIHDTFKKDLDAGYRTKDKEFAVSMAAQALAAAPQAPAAPADAEMLAALQAVAADVVHVGAGENTISDAARAKVEAVLEKIGAPWPGPAAAPAAPDDVLCYIRPGATLPERHGFEVCRATDAGAMAVMGNGRVTAPAAPAVDASDPALPSWWPDFIQCVAELPDRNSPEGEPDAMIATADELGACALAAQAAAKGAGEQ
jgi:hypothetical protein